jgi:glyceraldehyde 3-phosphate dehydrogenase
MSVKIGINGFGRIGRLMFRQAIQDKDNKFKIMAINDSKEINYLIYLLKYDSAHGKYKKYHYESKYANLI